MSTYWLIHSTGMLMLSLLKRPDISGIPLVVGLRYREASPGCRVWNEKDDRRIDAIDVARIQGSCEEASISMLPFGSGI